MSNGCYFIQQQQLSAMIETTFCKPKGFLAVAARQHRTFVCIPGSTIHESTGMVQYSTIHYSMVQSITVQHGIVRYGKVEYDSSMNDFAIGSLQVVSLALGYSDPNQCRNQCHITKSTNDCLLPIKDVEMVRPYLSYYPLV